MKMNEKMRLMVHSLAGFIGRRAVWWGFELLLGAELQALGDPQEAFVLFPLSGANPLEFQMSDPLENAKMKQRLSQHVLFRGPARTPGASQSRVIDKMGKTAVTSNRHDRPMVASVQAQSLRSMMDFYRPQSQAEKDILERARVSRSRDEIINLERFFRIERAKLGSIDADNAQPITRSEQLG